MAPGAPRALGWILLTVCVAVAAGIDARAEDGHHRRELRPGLAWMMFNRPWMGRVPAQTGVDQQIDTDTGTSIKDYGKAWYGLIRAPISGDLTIDAEADDGLRLRIGGKKEKANILSAG